MALAERLATLRRQHGDTLRDAAERTGVSASTLSRIERGETRDVHERTLARIAAGYQVTAEWLVGDDTPAARFEQYVRSLSQAHRLALFCDEQERVRVALEFVLGHCPRPVALAVAQATGRSEKDLQILCQPGSWHDQVRGNPTLLTTLITALSRHAGIRPAWFNAGLLQPGGRGWVRFLHSLCSRVGTTLQEQAEAQVSAVISRTLDQVP